MAPVHTAGRFEQISLIIIRSGGFRIKSQPIVIGDFIEVSVMIIRNQVTDGQRIIAENALAGIGITHFLAGDYWQIGNQIITAPFLKFLGK